MKVPAGGLFLRPLLVAQLIPLGWRFSSNVLILPHKHSSVKSVVVISPN
jgi:hypothetical protein